VRRGLVVGSPLPRHAFGVDQELARTIEL
jgi:hypothetical protein